MTSYFQMVVENTTKRWLRTPPKGGRDPLELGWGRGNVHSEENHVPFSGFVLYHCPAWFQFAHIAFFQVKERKKERKKFFECGIHSNEKAHQEVLLRG